VVPAIPKGEQVIPSLKLLVPKNKAPFTAAAVVNVWSYNWTGKGSVIRPSATFTPGTYVAVPTVKV
jgi:hypothetical protein